MLERWWPAIWALSHRDQNRLFMNPIAMIDYAVQVFLYSGSRWGSSRGGIESIDARADTIEQRRHRIGFGRVVFERLQVLPDGRSQSKPVQQRMADCPVTFGATLADSIARDSLTSA